jgi:hypothetical protein
LTASLSGAEYGLLLDTLKIRHFTASPEINGPKVQAASGPKNGKITYRHRSFGGCRVLGLDYLYHRHTNKSGLGSFPSTTLIYNNPSMASAVPPSDSWPKTPRPGWTHLNAMSSAQSPLAFEDNARSPEVRPPLVSQVARIGPSEALLSVKRNLPWARKL